MFSPGNSFKIVVPWASFPIIGIVSSLTLSFNTLPIELAKIISPSGYGLSNKLKLVPLLKRDNVQTHPRFDLLFFSFAIDLQIEQFYLDIM